MSTTKTMSRGRRALRNTLIVLAVLSAISGIALVVAGALALRRSSADSGGGGGGSPCNEGTISTTPCSQWLGQPNVKSAYYTCQKDSSGNWVFAGLGGGDKCFVECNDRAAQAPDYAKHQCVAVARSCDPFNSSDNDPRTTPYFCTCKESDPSTGHCTTWSASYNDVDGKSVSISDPQKATQLCAYVNGSASPQVPMAYPGNWKYDAAQGTWLGRTCGPTGNWLNVESNHYDTYSCPTGNSPAPDYTCQPNSPGRSCTAPQQDCPYVGSNALPTPPNQCTSPDPTASWCTDGAPNETCVAVDAQKQAIVGFNACIDGTLDATCQPCCLRGGVKVGSTCLVCPPGFGKSVDRDGTPSCYRLPPNYWDAVGSTHDMCYGGYENPRISGCNQNGTADVLNAGWTLSCSSGNGSAVCMDQMSVPYGAWYCSVSNDDQQSASWVKCTNPGGCNESGDTSTKAKYGNIGGSRQACTTTKEAGDNGTCGDGVLPKDCTPFHPVQTVAPSGFVDTWSSCSTVDPAQTPDGRCPSWCDPAPQGFAVPCVPSASRSVLSQRACALVVPNAPLGGKTDPPGFLMPGCANATQSDGTNKVVWCRGVATPDTCGSTPGCTWNAASNVCTACNEYRNDGTCPSGCPAGSNQFLCVDQ